MASPRFERMSLTEAKKHYWEASETLSIVATEEVVERVKDRYPTATLIKVTSILTDEYTEHDLVVLDRFNVILNAEDDWPQEHDQEWFLDVTEGICVFDDVVDIPIEGGGDPSATSPA